VCLNCRLHDFFDISWSRFRTVTNSRNVTVEINKHMVLHNVSKDTRNFNWKRRRIPSRLLYTYVYIVTNSRQGILLCFQLKKDTHNFNSSVTNSRYRDQLMSHVIQEENL